MNTAPLSCNKENINMNIENIPKEILDNPNFDIKYLDDVIYKFFIEIKDYEDNEHRKEYKQLLIDINGRIDAEYHARKSKEINEIKRVELMEAKAELELLIDMRNNYKLINQI